MRWKTTQIKAFQIKIIKKSQQVGKDSSKLKQKNFVEFESKFVFLFNLRKMKLYFDVFVPKCTSNQKKWDSLIKITTCKVQFFVLNNVIKISAWVSLWYRWLPSKSRTNVCENFRFIYINISKIFMHVYKWNAVSYSKLI